MKFIKQRFLQEAFFSEKQKSSLNQTYHWTLIICCFQKYYFKQLQMKLKITVLFFTLVGIGLSEQSNLPKQKQLQLSKINSNSGPISFIIAIIGIFLVILQAFLWAKIKKEKSMITFSVFNKGQLVNIASSYDQSHNDFASAKNEVSNEQQTEQQNESPGIKTIKGMTENKQKNGQSQQVERESERRRRKRKADKLSDRRQKQSNQQEN